MIILLITAVILAGHPTPTWEDLLLPPEITGTRYQVSPDDQTDCAITIIKMAQTNVEQLRFPPPRRWEDLLRV